MAGKKKQSSVLLEIGYVNIPKLPVNSPDSFSLGEYFNPTSKAQVASVLSGATRRPKYDPKMLQYYGGRTGYWNYEPDTALDPQDQLIIRPNYPMTGLRFVGFEHYNNGFAARVYYPDDDTSFSISSDSMQEAILGLDGIKSGGVLGGEWVWTQVGSHKHCLKVNSHRYQAILASEGFLAHPVERQ